MEPNETERQLQRGYQWQRRAYYSELITGDGNAEDTGYDYLLGSKKQIKSTWKVRIEIYAPCVTQLIPPVRPNFLAPAQRWIAYHEEPEITFPVETLKPKVQLPFIVDPKSLPRKVEIERRRRANAAKNLPKHLHQLGVSKTQLIPIDIINESIDPNQISLYKTTNIFPLELFDNEDFDERSPEDWMAMGYLGSIRHPLPGMSFLPKSDIQIISTPRLEELHAMFDWVNVAVTDYDPIKNLFYVLTLDGFKLTYKVPRIYVMFKAEDPERFASRVQETVNLRDKDEDQIRFDFFLDCLNLTGCMEMEEEIMDPIRLLATRNKQMKVKNEEFFSWVLKFLKTQWLEKITHAIRMSLRDVGKGWFDLGMKSWETYKFAKMSRLMELIKYHMQYAQRVLVENSLESYISLLETPCQCCLEVLEDFLWEGDLNQTPFRPKTQSIFTITLNLDKTSAYYDTNPDDFAKVLVQLLDTPVRDLHFIKQVQSILLTKIKWPNDLFLSSVGLIDPVTVRYRNLLENGYKKAIIPLKAYALRYTEFLDLYNMNNAAYIKKFQEENHIAGEIKEEIQKKIDLKMSLSKQIPLQISIGPFYVNTGDIRKFLVDKTQNLIGGLLDMFAMRMRNLMDVLSDQYKQIFNHLLEKPNCIEEVMDLREWIETIPINIKPLDDQTRKYVMEYEILSEFFYAISDEDFQTKWEVIGWPLKIDKQKSETLLYLDELVDKFRKVQVDDIISLHELIDQFVGLTSQLAKESDLAKVETIAVAIAKLWNAMKAAQEQGALLNTRQKLFGEVVTPFTLLTKIIKEFEPYKTLWLTADLWKKMFNIWMDNPLQKIDATTIDDTLQDILKKMIKLSRTFNDFPEQQAVALQIRHECEKFKPFVPLILALKNPGLKPRHFEQINEETGINIDWTSPDLTFEDCLKADAMKHLETIDKISEAAAKEFAIEDNINKMMSSWDNVNLEIIPYKTEGSHIMKVKDETMQMLDDQIVQTQQISFSPFKGAFEEQISNWERTLHLTSEVIDTWNETQKKWMYLEPIFTSEDISKQLPVESKKFNNMERIWKKVMSGALANPKVIEYCPDPNLLASLKDCVNLLGIVEKGLAEYLETKRLSFPRFYFLSDDELLEILAQGKNPLAVQPHLKKCFEAIETLTFEEDLQMVAMNSKEGESVPFDPPIYPRGNVEHWMLLVEESMKLAVKDVIKKSLDAITPDFNLAEWVLIWPGQVVLAGSQTHWTADVDQSLQTNTLPKYLERLLQYLEDLRNLVKGFLTWIQRDTISALIVIDVHARDVVQELVNLKIKNPDDFEWISQLRYYWKNEDLKVRAVNAEFQYGYEYLGNTGRLVITPLTDRCYLTLTGALHLNFGGAPQGPAGTGKTETTKDLGKAMAIQTVVFNCSDQLDYLAMGKLFKGLASAGAWACFDEFNRIDIEVLSVIAQQVSTIQKAQKARLERFMFEGVDLALKKSCAVFITMNPGYAGRTELPDNLKSLFRPVSMMVPNYTLIAEISLFSFGFSNARVLAGKITTTFKLSSEQLSSQDHYDFGMRAVKTVIAVAGNLKREQPQMDERQIVLRALRDVNVPKFLKDDLLLFNGIVSDLFPRMVEQTINYGELEAAIRKTILSKGLEDVKEYVEKVIQLYETTVVRHGLMIVGPTGSGKTKLISCITLNETEHTIRENEFKIDRMFTSASHISINISETTIIADEIFYANFNKLGVITTKAEKKTISITKRIGLISEECNPNHAQVLLTTKTMADILNSTRQTEKEIDYYYEQNTNILKRLQLAKQTNFNLVTNCMNQHGNTGHDFELCLGFQVNNMVVMLSSLAKHVMTLMSTFIGQQDIILKNAAKKMETLLNEYDVVNERIINEYIQCRKQHLLTCNTRVFKCNSPD